jgi:hypothetical protein
MKKTKDYRGQQLKRRLMEISGIQEPLSKKDEMIDLHGITYGELFDIIHQEVKNYFEETFDSPTMEKDEEIELDEELQRIIDELDFEIK